MTKQIAAKSNLLLKTSMSLTQDLHTIFCGAVVLIEATNFVKSNSK